MKTKEERIELILEFAEKVIAHKGKDSEDPADYMNLESQIRRYKEEREAEKEEEELPVLVGKTKRKMGFVGEHPAKKGTAVYEFRGQYLVTFKTLEGKLIRREYPKRSGIKGIANFEDNIEFINK